MVDATKLNIKEAEEIKKMELFFHLEKGWRVREYGNLKSIEFANQQVRVKQYCFDDDSLVLVGKKYDEKKGKTIVHFMKAINGHIIAIWLGLTEPTEWDEL